MEYETEWQFDAPDLAALRGQLETRPELAGFQLRRCPTRDLTDCYLDTPDARLAHAGFALRLRSEGAGCEATLKSLRGEGKGPVVRREIRQPVQERSVAALLAASGPVSDRTRAVVGAQRLEPLLTVRTHRDVFQVMDGDVDAAEIALDDTHFGEAGKSPVPPLQRVELELHDAPAASLEPLLAELRGSLALQPASLSKLAAGLAASGSSLPGIAEIRPLQIDALAPAAAVGQRQLLQLLAVWRDTEPSVRLGDDPEALHQLRVTGRRIVAVLRLLEAAPLGGALALRRRLQALLRRLSPLRDMDVQRVQLEAINGSLASSELLPLIAQMQRLRAPRQQSMLALLDSSPVQNMFLALDALARRAPLRQRRPIAMVAAALLRQRYRRVRRQARIAIELGTVEHCHQLRLQAKKLRYIAEPLAELYGEPMQRFLRRMQKLQTLLGQINDAHHAVANLERLAQRRRRLPPAALFSMGRVAEQQRRLFEDSRKDLPDAWRRVRGKAWRRLRKRMQELVGEPQLPLHLAGQK